MLETSCKEIFVDANHMRFALKVWNEELREKRPVILALHGWLDNAASFDLLAPLLDKHCVMALDHSGHGLSEHRPPGVPYHFVDYVADAFYVADALGLNEFILLGHSMGANVATTMAGVMPDKILGLILIEGFGPATRAIEETCENLKRSIEKFSESNSRKKRYTAFANLVKARRQGRWPLTEEAAQLLCERGSVEQDGQFTWSSDPRINYPSPLKMTSEQSGFIRSQITCPCQIIIGEQGIVPEISADKAPLNEFKTAEIHRMQGYHHLHMERERLGELSVLLNDFLSTIQE